MRGIWVSSLLLTVLVAALVAVPAADVRASVALCESELVLANATGMEQGTLIGPHIHDAHARPSRDGGSSRLGIDLNEIVSRSWLSLPAGMGVEPFGLPQKQPEQQPRQRLIENVNDAPAHMAPTSSSVLSHGTGSNGTFALVGTPLTSPQNPLQGALPPEARTILPTGPPGRLFRPPRSMAPLRIALL